ncbi:hypothetical protein [Paraburkholderia sp. MM5384-R2]|uniref:hypothetical protein n=1 Tax=Paraburkholderia sp. MM5384-R2 TaxID=2723097 RepID=UPI0016177756|nr:hypothetical protein [Paraburkholderia sp. MM5384-R2]MBB5501563.1 hypothetical protein [Paraburkholderia sp. MM5384-R2]
MRASLSDLAPTPGNSIARNNALSFIQFHRLTTAADDLASVLKVAVRSGEVIAVIEPLHAELTPEAIDAKNPGTVNQLWAKFEDRIKDQPEAKQDKLRAVFSDRVLALYQREVVREQAAYIAEAVAGREQAVKDARHALAEHDKARPSALRRLVSDKWERQRGVLVIEADRAADALTFIRKTAETYGKGDTTWVPDLPFPSAVAQERVRDRQPELAKAAVKAQRQVNEQASAAQSRQFEQQRQRNRGRDHDEPER